MSWYVKFPYCNDLPSKPNSSIGRILVTGASGYIGGRLIPELIERGYDVSVMVRAYSPEYQEIWPEVKVIVADALDYESVLEALDGIQIVYYLIHSMLLNSNKFEDTDLKAAINFRKASTEKKVKRIIYLGGLGDKTTGLSKHLLSRIKVAKELKRGNVPVTVLRAAIIIGSGSSPYEIISNLVRISPILFIPYWLDARCQPISIRDVIRYLVGVIEIDKTIDKSYDIGGPNILTYKEILETTAKLLNKKRKFIATRFSSITFYAYLASFLTPVPLNLIRTLFESSKNDVICLNEDIKKVIPIELIPYKEALLRAITREEQDDVCTSWTGAYPPAHELAIKLHELDEDPNFIASYSLLSYKRPKNLFKSICEIGGKSGWFNSNFLWKMRGVIDKIVMGVGTSRGRRSFAKLRVNDVIDFWRVEDLVKNEILLLRAEMKLPGKAWLEFKIKDKVRKSELTVTAYYQTSTFLGKVYWYTFLPFHHFIFNDLIKQIEKKS